MIYRVDTYSNGESCYPTPDYIADCSYKYLSQFLDGLTHTEHSTDIDFWGLFTLTIPNSRFMQNMSITPTGGSACSFGDPSDARIEYNRPVRHTILYDTNFLYYSFRDRDRGGLFNLIWFRDSKTGKQYAGGNNKWGSWTTGELYKTGAVLYDFEDTASPYTFAKMFNFTAPPGKIAIAQMQPFTKGGDFGFWTTDLYSCSTVPLFSTVSIMGDTFLALDTNTLIKLDMSEE